MEEDLRKSSVLEKSIVKKQLDVLKNAVDRASDKISSEAAHNSEIQYALEIVSNFLRKKGRVCYGGTAINALLPKSLQFYDYDKELPDYDFFTPRPESDIRDIVKELQRAGFTDVN